MCRKGLIDILEEGQCMSKCVVALFQRIGWDGHADMRLTVVGDHLARLCEKLLRNMYHYE